jgi:hypothetical protein
MQPVVFSGSSKKIAIVLSFCFLLVLLLIAFAGVLFYPPALMTIVVLFFVVAVLGIVAYKQKMKISISDSITIEWHLFKMHQFTIRPEMIESMVARYGKKGGSVSIGEQLIRNISININKNSELYSRKKRFLIKESYFSYDEFSRLCSQLQEFSRVNKIPFNNLLK